MLTLPYGSPKVLNDIITVFSYSSKLPSSKEAYLEVGGHEGKNSVKDLVLF